MEIIIISIIIVSYWTVIAFFNTNAGQVSMKIVSLILWITIIILLLFPRLPKISLFFIGLILFCAELLYLNIIKRKADAIKKGNQNKIKYIKSSR